MQQTFFGNGKYFASFCNLMIIEYKLNIGTHALDMSLYVPQHLDEPFPLRDSRTLHLSPMGIG